MNENRSVLMALFAVSVIIGIILGMSLERQFAWAASPRERKAAKGIIRQIKAQEGLLSWLKSLACASGVQEYCPKPIVEPEATVGQGKYTVRISVLATMFNNIKRQTDESPCEGAFGNICKAYGAGENPIAVSRDLFPYPLGKKALIKIEDTGGETLCKTIMGKTFTVYDTMADCLRKDKDLRTNRCHEGTQLSSRIDIFYPCEGDPLSSDYCILAQAHAGAFGVCPVTLIRI